VSFKQMDWNQSEMGKLNLKQAWTLFTHKTELYKEGCDFTKLPFILQRKLLVPSIFLPGGLRAVFCHVADAHLHL